MTEEELSKGLMFKVKDDAAAQKNKLKKDNTLGWALVTKDLLLAGGFYGHDSASNLYDELEHTLELELIHPTELVTGLAGKIHILCRPATNKEVEECRTKGWGYFRPYTPVDAGNRAGTPPLGAEVL
jgi:hypothetical protein